MRGLRRRIAAAGAAVVLLAACGSSESPTRVVPARGQVVEVRADGRELVVDHEEIAGWMEPMRMAMPVLEPDEARALEPGAKIAFEVVISDAGFAVRSFETLPADTPLDLAPPAP